MNTLVDWSIAGNRSASLVVGASAVQASATSVPLARGVVIKLSAAATGKVYVGFASTVTAGFAAPTTDGFELAPGEALDVEAKDLSFVWLLGSAAGQNVSLLYR